MAKVLLVGGGKMGGAMLGGWLSQGLSPGAVCVVEPGAEARAELEKSGVGTAAGPDGLPPDFAPDVIILAVKPQVMEAVAAPYARFAEQGAVFLSIAAGKTLAFFEALFGGQAAIVRAMPNTPAAVRRGVTVLCPNALVSEAQKDLCGGLLSAIGETHWIADEGLMDPVTAVSGCGPAYVFLLAECLAKAGVAAGLPPDLAESLARATVAGAGELLHQAQDSAAQLRINVTSPGGATAEALGVLMGEKGLEALMTEAVAAAAQRSIELARSSS